MFLARPGQFLEDHLRLTAEKAALFAAEFHDEEWGRLLGLFHDIGKFNPQWQKYIIAVTGLINEIEESDDENIHISHPNHSGAGAIYLKNKMGKLGLIPAYCIAGHHAGLPDYYHENGIGGALQTRLAKKDELDAVFKSLPAEKLPAVPKLSGPIGGQKIHDEYIHLWIRMLFSCLVDADRLDSEAAASPEKETARKNWPLIKELFEKLQSYLTNLEKNVKASPVNIKRHEILQECLAKAEESSGVFSLSVPTGGGKTLSAMAFAMKHAVKYGKKRIIMAIPYTSIIEQNASVYKNIFGAENVLEHHSNLDPEEETDKSKLAAENWEAPLIVTTNVQLFQSIFASSASQARKIHNLANSVIILDEAHIFPPEQMRAIISVLKGLVKYFGVTLVLCTATQPALCGNIGHGKAEFSGFENVREIISNPFELSEALHRTDISILGTLDKPHELSEIADELKKYEQVLCIVNSRKFCRELYSLLPAGTIHLSALMCPEERSSVISIIKNKLKNKETVRVISTQLIEAGVDIDFPVVFRALAGIDSIAQAAGRCNREGLMKSCGKVFVFASPDKAPPGTIRKGADTALEILHSKNELLLSPALYRQYFESYYAKVSSFDNSDFQGLMLTNANDFSFQFRLFASRFKMIDENIYKPVIVLYGKSNELIQEFKTRGPDHKLMRKLQRYSVNLPINFVSKFIQDGILEEICGVIFQKELSFYQPGIGFIYSSVEWNEQMFMA